MSALKAQEEQKSRKAKAAFRLFDVWFQFSVYAMRRYWWIMLLFVGFGMIGGYFNSLATTNRYEVRTAFLMSLEMANPEHERLMSRKLVAASVSKFKVSRWIDRGRRGLYEMYSESPFVVNALEIAPILQDIPLSLRFLSANQYEIEIETGEGGATFQGTIGKVSQLGTIVMKLDLVRPMDEKMLETQYFVSFNSDEAIVNRFLKNLEVVHLLDHPNRIALHYTDAHPDLAYDMLKAFADAYLDDHRRQRLVQYDERLRGVDAERRILETQIMSTPDAEPYLKSLAEAGSQLPATDSSMFRMLEVRLEIEGVRKRIVDWRRFQNGRLTWDSLCQEIARSPNQSYDSIFERADGPTMIVEGAGMQSTIVDTMIVYDGNRLKELDEKNVDIDADLIAASTFLRSWETGWVRAHNNPNGVWLVLREKYLSVLSETARIELEMRKEAEGPQLIDPPYHVPPHGRDLRLRVFAVNIFGMLLLGCTAVIILAYYRRRFSALIHFRVIASDNEEGLWEFHIDEVSRRRQRVQLELSLGKGCQSIAMVGNESTLQMAQELAQGLAKYGKRVAILDGHSQQANVEEHVFHPPKDAGDGWWFSICVQEFLPQLSEKYDRILICLPPPALVPEVLGTLRAVDAMYFIVGKQQTSVKEWHVWRSTMEQWGLDFEAIWVD